MVYPISSLQNMEYMLYGRASGVNPNCPSFSNGYMANSSVWNNQIPFGYNNQSVWNNWNNQTAQSTMQNPTSASDVFSSQAQQQASFGASSKDIKTLENYYLKGMEPTESLLGAAGSGAAFALVNNMRFIAHPFASLSSLGATEKMFAEVKKGGKLADLWKNPDTHKIMTDAYHRMHQLEGASKWRFAPLFKKRLDPAVYKDLSHKMEMALLSGNKQQIAEATERIRLAIGVKTGPVGQFFNKVSSYVTGGKVTTIADRLANNTAIREAATKNITEKAATGFGKAIVNGLKSQRGWGGVIFAGFEFLADKDNIEAAFKKDKSTGIEQLGQTSVKAAGSIIGWTVGEAVGAAAGAKIGAAVGTAVCPGLGTAIGAVAGLVGGSIGTWAMGKLTKWIVGEDVGSKVEAKKLTKTDEGRKQLLQLTAQQAQSDKKLDPKVAQALQNVAYAYAS